MESPPNRRPFTTPLPQILSPDRVPVVVSYVTYELISDSLKVTKLVYVTTYSPLHSVDRRLQYAPFTRVQDVFFFPVGCPEGKGIFTMNTQSNLRCKKSGSVF